MNALIKNATIICPTSSFHLQVKDLLIIDGVIADISENINDQNIEIISGNNLHVSIGWMDIFADFAEPGGEHRESLETGAAAALAGGFTDVMIVPNTAPTLSSKSQIAFLKERAKALPINIYPIAAVTKNIDGVELAELYDMNASGAVAYSDGRKSIQSPGLLLKALQYIIPTNAPLIQVPDDKSISDGGLINEGVTSTQLGLPGIPAIAEELMIARDISLLQYTSSKLHITGVSTKESLALIAKAKANGLQVTCSVTPYHLFFTEDDLKDYNTNLKVNPPLRTMEDRASLQKALAAGEIDCVASHHNPQSWDDKVCEFEFAKTGMLTLQTIYGTLNALLNDNEAVVKLLAENTRNIFNIEMPTIAKEAAACLTIFSPNETYTFTESMIKSTSKNSGFIGHQMKGKVIAVINKNNLIKAINE